jgi:hypothetical protein
VLQLLVLVEEEVRSDGDVDVDADAEEPPGWGSGDWVWKVRDLDNVEMVWRDEGEGRVVIVDDGP